MIVQCARVTILASAVAFVTLAPPRSLAQAPQRAPASARSGPRYTAADVEFMQGMIAHHAQAVVMATMAPSHGASVQVALFCRKILRSQADEIELMQSWLRDRGERGECEG